MPKCPSDDTIRRYVQQECTEADARSIETHLAECADCKERVASARPEHSKEPDDLSDIAQRETLPAGGQTRPTPGMPTLSMPEPSDTRAGRTDDESPELTTFEGYQIIEELPQGGQAVVYKAIHKATKAKVALKVLLPGLTASAKARGYFKQEVELAASLNHPNIVTIRDSGIARGQYYFAMNYIHGQPLDRYLQSQAFAVKDKLILFGKICDAIKHAHQRGVIHRDLKPSNILVDERGEPHILDFGLAKTAAGLNTTTESAVMPTITGQIKGTVAYMSPEQAAGRSDLVDVRTDVYSLGVVLYQMCTGNFPYDVLGTIIEALQNIQYTEPIRPRHTISRFDSDVEAIILKSLAKDPDQRYQSAAELKQDVQRWLDGMPIVAKSISSVYLLRKIVSRHRYTASVVGLLLVIVASFGCVSYQLYRRSERSRIAMKQALEGSTTNYLTSRQLAFLGCLQAWRQNDLGRAAGIARLIPDGSSKEKQAAQFLLASASAEKDNVPSKPNLSDTSKWLSDFLIAERYKKNGSSEEWVGGGCEKKDMTLPLEKNSER